MKPATEMRSGMVIHLEGDLFRVIEADYHAGGGKMHGAVHAKMRNLRTANVTERRFRQDERFEEVSLERQTMEFLYEDADHCTFMHPETYEQVSLPQQSLGPFLRFLKPNQPVQVEIFEGAPIEVIYPPTVELRVESTPQPVHSQHDSNVYKSATLENGIEVLVPQFIKTGDLVRVDVETGKYVERVK
ncbi:MAG: elongation factor P [Acidobacteriota bacterium]